MEFSDAHKKEQDQRNYFDYGVHKVKILGFSHDTTDAGKEFVKAGFTDMDGDIEDEARVWFTTEEASMYSFNTLRSIFVHNAPEDKKDMAREVVNAAKNTDELIEILNKKLIGKEMWITKYLDPKRTYEAKDGSIKPSINVNMYGYEPKLKESLMPKKETVAQAAGEVFKATESEDVPFKGSGTKAEDWA